MMNLLIINVLHHIVNLGSEAPNPSCQGTAPLQDLCINPFILIPALDLKSMASFR